MARTPVLREDDGQITGYITRDHGGWIGQTIFGYVITRSDDKNAVETAVREEGLKLLKGVWQYYDRDDHAWYSCKLKEVYENRVIVIRTTAMGYEEPDIYKQIEIKNPTETNLVIA